MKTKKDILILLLLLCASVANARQKFFNLTADEVRVDSVLPHFNYAVPLGKNFADSTYTVSILYPEFIDMTAADVEKYQRYCGKALPQMPVVNSVVAIERKKGFLHVDFEPLVERGGKYRKLVSFMLKVEAKPNAVVRRAAANVVSEDVVIYADNSVLASGNWAKIRVPSTGVYRLTEDLIRKAGFTDITKVHVYGYGGNMQPEKIDAAYLTETDDLREVPVCLSDGMRFFYGKGPVSWSNENALTRIRNPYSDYGYYFITQNDKTTATVADSTFIKSFFPSADDYHVIHEVDNYAWYEGGRELYENDPIEAGRSRTYTLKMPKKSTGHVYYNLSAGNDSEVSVIINDSICQKSWAIASNYNNSDYDDHSHGMSRSDVCRLPGVVDTVKVEIKTLSGGPVRLDYIAVTSESPADAPKLSASIPVPEYVYNITRQNHHADGPVDMVIVIPTSQNLRKQAERLRDFHVQYDGLTVRIIPADELYNEFSSGTPDVNAYRRYLKMLYDRAGSDVSKMPKYLLLFGDAAWDNRMNSMAWNGYSPDDFLLCYESENSFSSVINYVDDGFFCLLDNGEGGESITLSDSEDVAVGRFPVRNAEEAKVMVDKVISYLTNNNVGSWQNEVMVMGDDEDGRIDHMQHAKEMGEIVESKKPGMVVKRVMWDAYTKVETSTGGTYPDVEKLIKEQQEKGSLIMNYSGHGAQTQISHENVLSLSDFKSFTNKNLPLWITAACDIAPFDSQTENIGEQAVLNPNGGAVAFIGTSRTVYVTQNKNINTRILETLFQNDSTGKYPSVGEALRIAKNTTAREGMNSHGNKLKYVLLGDPALVLKIPTANVVIDSIDGKDASLGNITLTALSTVTVKGHVESDGNNINKNYNGALTAVVRDSEESIKCNHINFIFPNRNILYTGTSSVTNGRFSFTFSVPKDINYSQSSGQINVFAVDNKTKVTANGSYKNFYIGGTNSDVKNDSIGPSIYCYLNDPSFVNGGSVNTTPYFVAQISDENGLNTAGVGIGHDLELVIDGEMTRTYSLNNYFKYKLGSYTEGEVGFSIPELPEGPHTLKFRAWDVLNNSSVKTLDFNVVKGLQPNFFNVSVSENPARKHTTFIITHDRAGSILNVEIELFDLNGRQVWSHSERGTAPGNTYTVDWDLTVDDGRSLPIGIYIYRVKISSDGSSMVSKAKKLIVAQ